MQLIGITRKDLSRIHLQAPNGYTLCGAKIPDAQLTEINRDKLCTECAESMIARRQLSAEVKW